MGKAQRAHLHLFCNRLAHLPATTSPMRVRNGFSLLELLTVITLVGIMAGLAAPRFDALVTQTRARGNLDRISGALFHARMLAVRSGQPYRVTIQSSRGCITALQMGPLGTAGPNAPLPDGTVTRPLESYGLCYRHTGRGIVVYDGRGILRPTGFRVHVRAAGRPFQIVVSSAGRVRRLY